MIYNFDSYLWISPQFESVRFNILISFLTHFKTQTVSQTRKWTVTFIFLFLPIVIERLKQNFNKHKLESVIKHLVFLDFFFLTKIPQLPIKIVKTSTNTNFCFYSKDQAERKAWNKISCSMYYVKVKKHQTLPKCYLNDRGKMLFEWKRQTGNVFGVSWTCHVSVYVV